MGVKYLKDGRIQDLHFTININYKCNLNCSYCPLVHNNKVINKNIIDEYVNFLINNEEEIYKYCKNIVFIFFGGEALLDFEKIIYIINKLGFNNKKYVIYTNGLFINKNIISKLEEYNNKKIIFYISIDGNFDIMKKNRGFTKKQFNILIDNIKLLKNSKIEFSITKVISINERAINIFNSLKFLNSLRPVKLDFLPEAFSSEKCNYKIKKEILKGIDLFIEYLKSKGKKELEIMEYLGLPDEFEDFKTIYQIDFGIYLDLDGTIYSITDALRSFNIYKTFNKTEDKIFKLLDINNKEKLLSIIKNYNFYEKIVSETILSWYKREFPNDVYISRIIGLYFIKKLLIYKYKPQN